MNKPSIFFSFPIQAQTKITKYFDFACFRYYLLCAGGRGERVRSYLPTALTLRKRSSLFSCPAFTLFSKFLASAADLLRFSSNQTNKSAAKAAAGCFLLVPERDSSRL
jgi:hypothetical protein